MSKIRIGDRVPNFRLLNQEGVEINITSFIGKSMVIYFYPKDDTPGCTRQACSFRDEFHRFTDANVTVFGISADSPSSHAAFRAKYKLPFDLLSDEGNKVRAMFGVPSDMFGLIAGRVTYIVNSHGIVTGIYNSQLNVTKHVDEALKVLEGY